MCLTNKGKDLEEKLSNIQIDKIKNVIKQFEEKDINGFKKILYSMIKENNQDIFDQINNL